MREVGGQPAGGGGGGGVIEFVLSGLCLSGWNGTEWNLEEFSLFFLLRGEFGIVISIYLSLFFFPSLRPLSPRLI